MTDTVRLTTAQALVRFLAQQHSERDGVEQRLVTGMLGIFGHGNVAGVGQAVLQAAEDEASAAANDEAAAHRAGAWAQCRTTSPATSRARCTPRPGTPAHATDCRHGRHDLHRPITASRPSGRCRNRAARSVSARATACATARPADSTAPRSRSISPRTPPRGGADVLTSATIADFRANYAKAVAADRTTVLHIETDLLGPNPPGSTWWDVPVSEVSTLESTQRAYAEHVTAKRAQRDYL